MNLRILGLFLTCFFVLSSVYQPELKAWQEERAERRQEEERRDRELRMAYEEIFLRHIMQIYVEVNAVQTEINWPKAKDRREK